MANLVELFDNIVQMQNLNGVPLAAGKLYVYALGRTTLMDTWSDVDGESLNPNPIILDNAGQAHVYVSDDFDYTLVICDQYNNEIFSLDKYLYSKGSHSHADVAVAPSESIAVSSYHVGETTVYVPYLTGQLGKVYEGIDPIVVNNTEDKISANHVPLGVQDPLYFVQDDEEGCIIGFSGGTVPEGIMNESALGYQNGQITSYNGSAFKAGNSYEAGSYIDIDGNTINVTGLSPVPADTASIGLVASVSADITAMIPNTSDMATQTWVNEQGFLTAHQDISNKLDTTAFSTVSGNFLTAIPSEYVTENTLQSGLSSKLDSTAFSTVSGSFLTAHQDLSDYATTAQLSEVSADITAQIPTDLFTKASADTLYQPIGNYLSSNALEGYATENWVTSQGYLTAETDWSNTITAASANAYNEATAAIPTGLVTTGDLQTVSGEITAMIPSTAGLATESFVTSQGYITNDDITGKQDISGMTAYQEAGNYYSASNPSGFITGVDLTPYQLIADMTAYQAAGNYLSSNALDNLSGNWETVTAKLDTTAFSNVSGIFLTAHQDLSDYQTIAGMTAYQPILTLETGSI